MSIKFAIPADKDLNFKGDLKDNVSDFFIYEIYNKSASFLKRIPVENIKDPVERLKKLKNEVDFVILKDIDVELANKIEKENNFEIVVISKDADIQTLAQAFALSYEDETNSLMNVNIYSSDYKESDFGKSVIDALRKVIDGEIGQNIVDFGLIREFNADPETKSVSFVFIPSSPVCPLAYQLALQIKIELKNAGVEDWNIKIKNYVDIEKLEKFINEKDT